MPSRVEPRRRMVKQELAQVDALAKQLDQVVAGEPADVAANALGCVLETVIHVLAKTDVEEALVLCDFVRRNFARCLVELASARPEKG